MFFIRQLVLLRFYLVFTCFLLCLCLRVSIVLVVIILSSASIDLSIFRLRRLRFKFSTLRHSLFRCLKSSLPYFDDLLLHHVHAAASRLQLPGFFEVWCPPAATRVFWCSSGRSSRCPRSCVLGLAGHLLHADLASISKSCSHLWVLWKYAHWTPQYHSALPSDWSSIRVGLLCDYAS